MKEEEKNKLSKNGKFIFIDSYDLIFTRNGKEIDKWEALISGHSMAMMKIGACPISCRKITDSERLLRWPLTTTNKNL